MKTYIALLRGINVSGQKIIRMTDLKSLMEEIKFQNVQTYIQSGNIVFRAKASDLIILRDLIADKIYDSYGFKVITIVMTPGDLEEYINACPYKDDFKKVYFTFFSEVFLKENLDKLNDIDYSPEEYTEYGNVLIFYYPDGYGKAKLTNNVLENKLKMSATTRNWKTVNTLLEMAKNTSVIL